MIHDLRKPNKYEVSDEVITTKGFSFTVLGDGLFQDVETKLIWGPLINQNVNHHEATELAAQKLKRLPTKEEFERVEKHGFRDLFDVKDKWLWSSSVYPYYSDHAYMLFGGNGGIDNFNCSFSYGNDAVLCVGQ